MPSLPLPEAVRQFLEAPNLATVATLGGDGAPHATVVWFLLDGDRVLVNTRLGRAKVRNLARDPRCALAVFDSNNPYRSVQLRGRVVASHRGAQAAADIHRLSRRYTQSDYRDPEARISYWIGVESWSAYGVPGAE